MQHRIEVQLVERVLANRLLWVGDSSTPVVVDAHWFLRSPCKAEFVSVPPYVQTLGSMTESRETAHEQNALFSAKAVLPLFTSCLEGASYRLVRPISRRSVSEPEVLVDRTNACRPFANSRRDSLGRAEPDVADGEEPGVTGLEGERSSPECLPSPFEVFGAKGSVGEHEAMIVESRASAQPT